MLRCPFQDARTRHYQLTHGAKYFGKYFGGILRQEWQARAKGIPLGVPASFVVASPELPIGAGTRPGRSPPTCRLAGTSWSGRRHSHP